VKAALRGKITDMGDLIVQEIWHVKGRQLFNIRLHIGAVRAGGTADRCVGSPSVWPRGELSTDGSAT